MVDNYIIQNKIVELENLERTLSEKLSRVRNTKDALNVILLIEQKELISSEGEEATYRINVIRKTDPHTFKEITDARRDEIWASINTRVITT